VKSLVGRVESPRLPRTDGGGEAPGRRAMMAMRPHLGGGVCRADDPADAAATLTRRLAGGSIGPGRDGQHVVEGLGKSMALEPATADLPSGPVTS
jgi:hypothetical protein